MQDLMSWVSRTIDFLKTDVWRIRLTDLPAGRSFFIKQLRMLILAIRGFGEDRCQLRASALTFYSLLSLVPVVAMAFGVAKGFGFEKHLEADLLERFAGQREVLGQVIAFAHSLLENTKGGMIAGVGLLVLFWTVVKVLGHIERSFNDVWEIEGARPFRRKLSDYLSIMVIGPLLIIIAGSITVFIKTQVELITAKVGLLGIFSPLIFSVLSLSPYLVMWMLFTFLYVFMPNTRVDFKSGLLAGVVAGTAFQVTQLLYIAFQVGVAKYNAIYGSFAALPLFLVWLHFSWLIVLFGAEISFAHQNVETYELESDSTQISTALRRLLSLQIAHRLVRAFARGDEPLTAPEMSRALEIPIRLTRSILHELTRSGAIASVNAGDDRIPAYQPACDIQKLTIGFILNALDRSGTDNLPVAQTEAYRVLTESMAAFKRAIEISPENRLLKDI